MKEKGARFLKLSILICCFLLSSCRSLISSTSSDSNSQLENSIAPTIYHNESDLMTAFNTNLLKEETSFALHYDISLSPSEIIDESNYVSSYMTFWISENEGTNYSTANFDVAYHPYATSEADEPSYTETTNTVAVAEQKAWNTEKNDNLWDASWPKCPLTIQNSEELYYTVELGYRPEKMSEKATKIYNEAQAVAENNFSWNATVWERACEIYDWLGDHVRYNDGILKNKTSYPSDAYFLEGVFNRGTAVCDGIAKAFVLLCGFEGIHAVRVTGTHDGGNHAWNYVYLNGNYYAVDPTSNSTLMNSSHGHFEFASHCCFLQTNQYLKNEKYVQTSFPTYGATSSSDFYWKTKWKAGNDTHSCYATGNNDLFGIFDYLKYGGVTGPKTYEFYVGYSTTVNQISLFTTTMILPFRAALFDKFDIAMIGKVCYFYYYA